jgi:pimeloyl-ACP methyl ester carboxylesterase
VPVLAVGAGGGPFTAGTMAQAVPAGISSVQLDGTGHYPTVEAPEGLAEAVVSFIDGIDAA